MFDIYLLIEGKQEGPYTEDQVREYLAEGRFQGDQLAWHEGLAEWTAVSGVLSEMNAPAHADLSTPADVSIVDSEAANQGEKTPHLKPRISNLKLVSLLGALCLVAIILVWAKYYWGLGMPAENAKRVSASPTISTPETDNPALTWVAVEAPVAQIDSSWIVATLKVSPNRKRVACAAKAGDKYFVVVDGKEEKPYDVIGDGSLIFSPDSQRVAYTAKAGDKWLVVVDGKEGQPYDAVGTIITFSPDSQRVAYTAKAGDKYFVVVDGKEGQPYDGIGKGTPIFSPDSKRVAYETKAGDKWSVVVDGEEERPYDSDGPPIFSPDSTRVAYAAEAGDKWSVVVDGKEEKAYDGVGTSIFSPDSKRLAYAAKAGDKYFVVTDGKEGQSYDGIFPPIFSPDSKRLACFAKAGNKWLVVVDGKEGEPYDVIGDGSLIFSPDSQRIAYGALTGNNWIYVVNGKEEKPYASLCDLIFSPDSQRLAYVAKVGDKWFVVVDGREDKSYDGITKDTPIFSPDSKWVTYSAQVGDKRLVVVNGKEEKPYDNLVIEGGETPLFDSSDRFHYLAVNGNCIYLVEETLTAASSNISTSSTPQASALAETTATAQQGPASLSVENIRAGKVEIATDRGVLFSVQSNGGTDEIVIVRSLSTFDQEKVIKYGLKIGAAYLVTKDGGLKFIRDVDLKLDNDDLTKQFGVDVDQK